MMPAPDACWSFTTAGSGTPDHAQCARSVASRFSAAGMPNMSHAQGAYHDRSPDWTVNELGTAENGGADHRSVVPGFKTTTCASASDRNASAISTSEAPDRWATSLTVGARPPVTISS